MDNSQEQFHQMMTRLRANSRAASQSKDDVRITEMVNGVIVTRPARKYEEITEATPVQKEPKIIDLQEHAKSKAGSIPNQGINKLKVIRDFMNRGY